MNAETQADLRKHHFSLGYNDYEQGTEYAGHFIDKKSIIGEKEKKQFAERKKFLSQHNFKLGRDPE